MPLKSEKLFEMMETHLKTTPEAVKKVGGVIHMEVAEKKGAETTCWTLDLKNGAGKQFDVVNLKDPLRKGKRERLTPPLRWWTMT